MSLRRLLLLVAGLGLVDPLLAAPTTSTADFTDNNDGSVTHKITGLTWKRCAEGQTWAGSTCSGTAKTYSWDQANALSNSSGWRLPRIDELVTIVERDNYKPAINATIFPNTSPSFFWSASATYHADKAWSVFFHPGFNFPNSKTHTTYVRMVRGGQPLGSSKLYTPTSDFTDNGDGTVTHKKTGLVWKRCAEGQTWTGSTCSGIASSYTWSQANTLGVGGWRLPNLNELLTIVEWGKYASAINTEIFPNLSTNNDGFSSFWSTSAYVNLSDNIWGVNFSHGHDGAGKKTATLYARLVRGG